ncbi:hypothetical protein TNCV_864991 [Trichonephila clavipes]|nr:hypothetical protein TNCV_864991 [Trichonephila clavipes]
MSSSIVSGMGSTSSTKPHKKVAGRLGDHLHFDPSNVVEDVGGKKSESPHPSVGLLKGGISLAVALIVSEACQEKCKRSVLRTENIPNTILKLAVKIEPNFHGVVEKLIASTVKRRLFSLENSCTRIKTPFGKLDFGVGLLLLTTIVSNVLLSAKLAEISTTLK